MSSDIKLILVDIAFLLVGVLYFLAGVNAWKYPSLKHEFDGDNKKIFYRFIKIVLGIVLMLLAMGSLAEQLF